MTIFTGDWYGDVAIMYEILKELPLYTGNDRAGNKIYMKDNVRKMNKLPQSCKYGTTWRCMMGDKVRTYSKEDKGYLTKLREDRPELHYMFKEFSQLHFPDFMWTDITINYMPKGTTMKLHYDKVNVGDSILCAFGDYTGGNTFIQQKKGIGDYDIYDAREKFIKFNGSQLRHFVSSVKSGKRFSLVFYNSKNKF